MGEGETRDEGGIQGSREKEGEGRCATWRRERESKKKKRGFMHSKGVQVFSDFRAHKG